MRLPFPHWGGASADHVEDSCASNRVDTDAIGTTHKARASNGVSVGAVNGLSGQLKTMIQSFVPSRRTYMVRAAFVKGRPALHDDTDGLSELAKMANSLLRRECDVVVKKNLDGTRFTSSRWMV